MAKAEGARGASTRKAHKAETRECGNVHIHAFARRLTSSAAGDEFKTGLDSPSRVTARSGVESPLSPGQLLGSLRFPRGRRFNPCLTSTATVHPARQLSRGR